DSGRAGHEVESRNAHCSGGRRVYERGRQHRCAKTQGAARDLSAPAPAGSESAACTQGLPRNLGDLVVSGASWERTREDHNERVRDNEKSERRSKSEEAGEPTRGTRRSKGRRRESEPSEGTMGETSS